MESVILCHNLRRPSKDINKPNFIFSSDIPDKINEAADIFQKFHSKSKDGIDIVNFDKDFAFTVNVELNVLLRRNRQIRPSDLMKDNLIYLATINDQESTNNYASSISAIASRRNVCLQQKIKLNELFIVSIVLKVLSFVILKDEKIKISLKFAKDENYGILLLSDEQLIQEIINFASGILKQHLQIADEDNINIQADTRKDETQSKIVPTFDHNGDKGKDSVSDDDYNSSLEELLILKSNDSRTSSHDPSYDTEVDIPKNSHINEDDSIFTIKDNESNPNSISNIPNLSKESKDGFLDNVNNLRHNDASPFNVRTDEVHEHNRRNLIPENVSSSPSVDIDDVMSDDLQSPVKSVKHPSTYSSPSKQRSLSTKSSNISLVNYEDYHPELKYAFQSKPSSVPHYLKEDKKYKFIKVGKVQKYVHLFEEKQFEEDPKPRRSRPVSPLKKDILARKAV
ncbi:Piso0_004788 [Millerozyma farinosa CBS 7064]|uniref:Piso0_004788 protein n=1 Tax=Pichia sorbitophila (strain ATCC MYA-4447 / BCRC 22081 / CBS 7064 / NBRC 10061 / NRRL Y-12695) TaxID=559304 RepID=G8Y0F2_PICSO|nr:Piso0_004788 [Millerozyma farinosa CBS 7064]